MDAGAAGKTFPSYEFHVERGKIREFADAIGDPNPIYRDPDYAAEMGFAGVLAPPTMLRTFLYEPKAASEALKVKDWSYIVHGEQEFEYFAPIVAGDVLTARERIAGITEKESRRAGAADRSDRDHFPQSARREGAGGPAHPGRDRQEDR
jgi:acyl dehydratase